MPLSLLFVTSRAASGAIFRSLSLFLLLKVVLYDLLSRFNQSLLSLLSRCPCLVNEVLPLQVQLVCGRYRNTWIVVNILLIMSRRAYTLLILNYYLRLLGLPAIFAIVLLAIIVRQHNFVLAILSLKLLMQRIHWNALVCCAALRRCRHVLIRTCGSSLRGWDGLLWVAIDYNNLGLVLLWARFWLWIFSLTAFFCLAWMPASLCRLVQAVLLQLVLAILKRPLR